jgi:hypothetical protein
VTGIRSTLLASAFAAGLAVSPVAAANTSLQLQTDTDVATAGYFRLQWEAGDTPTRLVESIEPAFETAVVVYEGPDTARLISGKSDGDYFYRLEKASAHNTPGSRRDVVSNTLQVSVRHHSLVRAFTFFAIGAAVFAATLALVLFGGRNERGQ